MTTLLTKAPGQRPHPSDQADTYSSHPQCSEHAGPGGSPIVADVVAWFRTVRGKVVQFAMRCMWFRCIRAISDRTSRRGARGAGYARKCGGSNAERGTFLTLGRRDRPSGPLEVPPGPQSRGPACGGQGGPLGARWTLPDAGTYRCVKNVPRSALLPTLPTGRAPRSSRCRATWRWRGVCASHVPRAATHLSPGIVSHPPVARATVA